VKQTQGSDPGIVNDRALQQGWSGDTLEHIQVSFALGEKPSGETLEEPSQSIQGYRHRCGIFEDARVGYYSQKLMHTGPWNTDRFRPRDCFAQHLSSALVERHFLAMRVDEQVGVDSNHAPRSR